MLTDVRDGVIHDILPAAGRAGISDSCQNKISLSQTPPDRYRLSVADILKISRRLRSAIEYVAIAATPQSRIRSTPVVTRQVATAYRVKQAFGKR
jgi:hypothetical protein